MLWSGQDYPFVSYLIFGVSTFFGTQPIAKMRSGFFMRSNDSLAMQICGDSFLGIMANRDIMAGGGNISVG